MRKLAIVAGFVVLAVILTSYAYAADGGEVTAWQGFWNSVGGFCYNALPWNWGNWAGQS